MTIALSEKDYSDLVARAEQAIRYDFDHVNGSHEVQARLDLVTEARRLGCSTEFIEELIKDM